MTPKPSFPDFGDFDLCRGSGHWLVSGEPFHPGVSSGWEVLVVMSESFHWDHPSSGKQLHHAFSCQQSDMLSVPGKERKTHTHTHTHTHQKARQIAKG